MHPKVRQPVREVQFYTGIYWHLNDVAATLEKVTAMGAKEYEPLKNYGEAGFITASVVYPFGNILGIMYNPHLT
jgi:predicted enzyme related to lactoylglutathione lyase